MNSDIVEGKWKQLRGKVKEAWGKLTDDDLDKIDGKWDRLAGTLQEKYGFARDKAETEAKNACGCADDNSAVNKTGKSMKMASALLGGLLLAGMSLGVACSSTEPGVTATVKSKLAADDTVKAYKIDVDTNAGVVTLTGSVDSQAEKDRAMRIARDTKGVRDVVDMIAVRTAAGNADAPEPSSRSLGDVVDDAGITMAVKGRLLDDPTVKGLKIDVDTREGVVYLTGSVRSMAEKDRAVELARETKDVRNVVTNLTIEKS